MVNRDWPVSQLAWAKGIALLHPFFHLPYGSLMILREFTLEAEMMKAMLCSIFLSLLLSHVAMAEGQQSGESETCMDLTTDKVGNIFYHDESVGIKATGKKFPAISSLELQVALIDFWNNVTGKKSIAVSLAPKNGDEFTTTIAYKTLSTGFYICQVKAVSDGKVIASNYLRLGVITRKPDLNKIVKTPFCIDSAVSWFCETEAELRAAARLIKMAGISCVRDRLSWAEVEPVRGEYNWTKYDRSATILHEAGLEISQVFHDIPPWADTAPEGEVERRRYPPRDYNYLYDFMYNMAKHFKGRVQYWEIWNEYDAPTFFVGKPQEYASMLKSAYRAAKKADPNCVVLIGSTSFAEGKIPVPWVKEGYLVAEGPRYVEKTFESEICDYFDVYNMHFYGPAEGVVGFIERSQNLLKKFSCQHKPIWITEMGKTALTELPTTVLQEEQEQAAFIVRAYAVALDSGIEKLFFFIFPAFVEHGKSNWGIFANTEKGWIPKPAYVAFSVLIDRLAGTKPAGKLNLPQSPNIAGYKFVGSGKKVIILWARNGSEENIVLPIEADALQISDIMGNTIKTRKEANSSKGTTVKLKSVECIVGPMPIYIEYK